jgi:hypothetical protein
MVQGSAEGRNNFWWLLLGKGLRGFLRQVVPDAAFLRFAITAASHNIIDLLCRPVAPFGAGGLGIAIWGVPFPS